ncbi:Calmodulin calcium-dependent NAD kinase, partial [Cucurbita argyrosperma subsp. sororia]
MKHEDGGFGKVITSSHYLNTSFVGGVPAAGSRHFRRTSKAVINNQKLIPHLHRTESGRVDFLERFSHYVARQLGISDADECPQLCKLANNYLRKTKGCEEEIYAYFASEADGESLYVKLMDEFDQCILSYFAFHWSQASLMITQVLGVDSEHKKLKDLVVAATRKQRFDRVSKDLKVTRVFSTLVEEMKKIGCASSKGESKCSHATPQLSQRKRSPVLLLMGGGMGAGKSTVLKDILKEPFWLEAKTNRVMVEADAFKETDVIYKAISSMGYHDDMLQTAELVHQPSIDAASSLLVTALNEGRDVILDSTLSWEPYVMQTIEMARNIHKRRYRMGVGYKVEKDNVTENYWEPVSEEEEEELRKEHGEMQNRMPYRIELVGVVCDAHLAVVRGIRRAIMMGRAVRVNSQLQSHKRFANAFPKYSEVVDSVRLYSTNSFGKPPKLIHRKEGDDPFQMFDPEANACLSTLSNLNPDAESVYELYPNPSQFSEPEAIWKEIAPTPSRVHSQKQLRSEIKKVESSRRISNEIVQ